MGCTYDEVNARFEKKEHTELFTKLWNELVEDLYEETILDEGWFTYEDGSYYFSLAAEPLFDEQCDGEQLVPLLCAFLETVPDCELYLQYFCEYTNCGFVTAVENIYKAGKLRKVVISGEPNGDGCDNCGWSPWEDDDFDGDCVCEFEEYKPDKEYKCPKCGAILNPGFGSYESIYSMKDGKLEGFDCFLEV